MSDSPLQPPHSGNESAAELKAGTRLGPYEIANRIGAGGMGVVYQARDTRLDRSVAIKVLLGTGVSDADQRARFEREARAIAQLQHPGICTLHDVGSDAGREYLVMEMLTGETLASRLARGHLPMNEVLTLGAGIATALAAAHARDILHRDLKPANVMLTKSGPKLLDFGLAKLSASGPFDARQGFTAARTLTGEGTIVGTLGYMAPEQLRGETLDARADLWALGCVLYEMATGQSPFQAASTASTIAAILEREPKPLTELLPLAPAGFERLVHACLAKDPEGRWQSAADLARELVWLRGAASGLGAAQVHTPAPPSRLRRLAPWAVTGLAATAAFGLAVARLHPAPAAPRGAIRAVLPLSDLGFDPFTVLTSLSPDGKQVAVAPLYSQSTVGVRLLTLAGGTLRTLPDTEGGAQPFWSPDGSEIGFFQGRRLRRIKIATGEAATVCELADDPRGAAWGSQGVIVFSGGRSGGLSRVAEAGGVAQAVTQLDKGRLEATHRWPVFLPDGKRFLYYASDNISNEHETLLLGSLAGGPSTVVLTGTTNAVLASGHLLYIRIRDSTLVAQAFDATHGTVEGDAVTLASGAFYGMGANLAPISASDAGDLLYLSTPSSWDTELGWFDRAGHRQGTLAEPAPWLPGRVSPDGRSVVAARTDISVHPTRTDLWLFDLASNRRTRLTFGPGDAGQAAWSRDSRRLVYELYSHGEASIRLLTLPEGRDQALGIEPRLDDPSFDWSSDGRNVAYAIFNPVTGSYDLQELDVATGAARPWLDSKADERYPRYSPDGQLMAYQSNESGRHEIYVRRRQGAEKWQASVDGGRMPHWAKSGRELIWLGPDDRLVTATVEPGQAVRFGITAKNPDSRPFTTTQWFDYDLTADGARVLADAPLPSALDPKVRLVVNWPALLEP